MKRYDPNPDVNEVLVYSGAGAAAEKRRRDESDARLWAATREVSDRMQAEWAADEAADRRAGQVIFAVTAAVILTWIAVWAWIVFR